MGDDLDQPDDLLADLLVRYLASVAVIAAAVRPMAPALADRLLALLDEGPRVVQPRLATERSNAFVGG